MANPNSRATLVEYCLRRLGDPVIEINIDPDQQEDREDEALQYYQEFHSDSTLRTFLKHQVTSTDVTNEYITLISSVQFISRMFRVHGDSMSRNFFDVKYQLHLNDIANMHTYIGDLAYYEQMQQYLALLDMKLNGNPQITFATEETVSLEEGLPLKRRVSLSAEATTYGLIALTIVLNGSLRFVSVE